MADWPPLTADGELRGSGDPQPCHVSVTAEGLEVRLTDDSALRLPGHEMSGVMREGYELRVSDPSGANPIILGKLARRTDEAHLALRRCRADALATMMAPPGARPREVTEIVGEVTGFLFRYDDGLRWVPDAGDCFTRLYAELDGARADMSGRDLALTGPFGEQRLGGLRRLLTEIEAEAAEATEAARREFAEKLEEAGLPWANPASDGRIRQHVPFAADETMLRALDNSADVIHEERRDYWDLLRGKNAIDRIVVSISEDGLRLAAVCMGAEGEVYELLSEADHATFVFARADDAVRALTEVGFRREPIFGTERAEGYAVLADLLPSLRAAREGLRQRVIHDDPSGWYGRLFKRVGTP
ncbi:MAG: hypothetical protein GX131_03150 [candidate division WS1 bacterium]|nr:hypothetical protein [candidate division WS1 bacterium]